MTIVTDTIQAIAGAVQAVLQVLQTFNSARSCILDVENHANITLRKITDEHSHGGFAVIPQEEIPPHMADEFGSQSKGGAIATGTQGSVSYNGDGIGLVISWDNPFIGDNSCNAVLTGATASRYKIIHTCGVGNQNAHNKYELFERTPPNFKLKFMGNPVLIRSRFGTQGNFELMIPLTDGGITSYFRDNDSSGLPWEGPVVFGQNQKFDDISMIQSNFGNPGNLEVVCRIGDKLVFFWRDSGPAFNWNGPFPLIVNGNEIRNASSNPVLIQSHFGTQGNFEVIVPRIDSGFDHYFRNNDNPNLPWIQAPSVGVGQRKIDGISFIESDLDLVEPGEPRGPGNLEVITKSGKEVLFFSRSKRISMEWSISHTSD